MKLKLASMPAACLADHSYSHAGCWAGWEDPLVQNNCGARPVSHARQACEYTWGSERGHKSHWVIVLSLHRTKYNFNMELQAVTPSWISDRSWPSLGWIWLRRTLVLT